MSTETNAPEIRVPTWEHWYDVAEVEARQLDHAGRPAYSLILRFRPDDAEVYATYRHESESGVPMEVFHGLVRQYRPQMGTGLIDAKAFGAWLASPDVQEHLIRIAEGFSIEWDGSNHVGRLTTDAQNAEERLMAWLGMKYPADSEVPARPEAAHWHAGYFLESVGPEDFGITAETTDDQLEEIAQAEHEAARDEHGALVYGLEDHMHTWREALRERGS